MISSKQKNLIGLIIGTTAVGTFVVLGGCGSADVDPGATASESASELVTSSINGAIASSSDTGSGSLAFFKSERPSLIKRTLDAVFSTKNAWAVTQCPTIAASIGNCVSATGVMPVVLSQCNYIKPDGANYYTAVWNGTINYQFSSGSDMSGTPYCPAAVVGTSFPLGSSAPSNARPVTMSRNLTNVTKTSADGKTVITIDTSVASGWDSAVGQKSGGILVTFNTNTTPGTSPARAVTMKGTHYTATRSYTTKKGVAKTATIWDHTVSGTMSTTVQGQVHTSTGTIVLQHNLAKYTATATLAGVVHDHLNCGCLPKAGTITTVLTGSKTGTETLAISSCGVGTLTDTTGATSTVTLTHCQ